MLVSFQQFAAEQQLFGLTEPILVAFSSGIDSAALAQLLYEGAYTFAIAHCNFALRGADSDGDEAFAQQTALRYGVAFHHIRFDTAAYVAQHSGVSIQMAARQLRYEWLEQVRLSGGYACIATAHHQNDIAETMLYNLTMGTGIGGLHGILPRRGALVRPLLFANKAAIIQYVAEKALPYREDASNAETKYARNRIRHGVVPVLQQINPRLPQTFYDNARRFAETELIYREGLARYHRQICTQHRHETLISIGRLYAIAARRTVLYELLSPYGFNADQVEQILARLPHGEAGKVYYSPSHQLLRDRKHLILSQRSERDVSYVLLQADMPHAQTADLKLTLSTLPLAPDFVPPTEAHIATLALDKLAFPLLLRRVQAGDYFYPLGMSMKKKKLSRFFNDLKLNKNDRERAWVVEDQRQRIVWVVGYRIDERFRLTPHTATAWTMEIVAQP